MHHTLKEVGHTTGGALSITEGPLSTGSLYGISVTILNAPDHKRHGVLQPVRFEHD